MTTSSIFPEQYRETCETFLRAYYERLKWNASQGFLITTMPILTDEALFSSPLANDLDELAHAALGEYRNETALGVVRETIQGFVESLFVVPSGTGINYYDIPREWWNTPIGQMVARAQVFVRGDELITQAQAAELAGVTIQAIGQAIAWGRLNGYTDPDAPLRQGRLLVTRKEVEEEYHLTSV